MSPLEEFSTSQRATRHVSSFRQSLPRSQRLGWGQKMYGGSNSVVGGDKAAARLTFKRGRRAFWDASENKYIKVLRDQSVKKICFGYVYFCQSQCTKFECECGIKYQPLERSNRRAWPPPCSPRALPAPHNPRPSSPWDIRLCATELGKE